MNNLPLANNNFNAYNCYRLDNIAFDSTGCASRPAPVDMPGKHVDDLFIHNTVTELI